MPEEMKIKEMHINKGVTIGMPNYGSVRLEFGITAATADAKKLGGIVDNILQAEIDKTMKNLGQFGKRYTIINNEI